MGSFACAHSCGEQVDSRMDCDGLLLANWRDSWSCPNKTGGHTNHVPSGRTLLLTKLLESTMMRDPRTQKKVGKQTTGNVSYTSFWLVHLVIPRYCSFSLLPSSELVFTRYFVTLVQDKGRAASCCVSRQIHSIRLEPQSMTCEANPL